MEAILNWEKTKKIQSVIMQQVGLAIPDSRVMQLKLALCQIAQTEGYETLEAFVDDLLMSPITRREIELIAKKLTINESYFLREERCFEVLKSKMIPDIIEMRDQDDKTIRIWCAGCSTGEEPYSVAMTLYSIQKSLKDWSIEILGTDIDTDALAKAQKGIYTEWSFRNTPHWIKERFFVKNSKGLYVLNDNIKEMVEFKYLNLAEEQYPKWVGTTKGIDIIFCRNVLMYFTPIVVEKVIARFRRCLTSNGCLIVSVTETSSTLFSDFETESSTDFIFYRKTNLNTDAHIKEKKHPMTRKGINRVKKSVNTKHKRKTQTRKSRGVLQPKMSQIECLDHAKKCFDKGLFDEVIHYLQHIPKTYSHNIDCLQLLARTYANVGKLNEAREVIEEAIALSKLEPSVYILNADILQEMGFVQDAIQSIKKVIYLNDQLALAHFTLGNLYLKSNDTQGALKYFKNALKLLENNDDHDIVPESEGLSTVGLKEIIQTLISMNLSEVESIE